MASYGLHLLVAEEYLKLHSIENPVAFVEGTLAPDNTDDKNSTHYSKYNKKMTYTDMLVNKVDLCKYVQENKLDSCFKRGEFLHLLTDYVFYTQYLIKLDTYKAIEHNSIDTLNKILYEEYYRVMHWIDNNYHLQYRGLIPNQYNESSSEDMQIFDEHGLRRVVQYIVDIDIDRFYDMIKDSKGEFRLDLTF